MIAIFIIVIIISMITNIYILNICYRSFISIDIVVNAIYYHVIGISHVCRAN